MPGYNHYFDCTCGWCVKHGGLLRRGLGIPSAAVPDENHYYYSKDEFFRNGLKHSRSACFVAPNAQCPVCGQRVYYYGNEFGSRVFFEELGWPWPKHPCTDSKAVTNSYRSESNRLVVRGRGRTAELLEAATAIGVDLNDRFRRQYGFDVWALVEITACYREGLENLVAGRQISTPTNDPMYFTFCSRRRVIVAEQVVSIKASQLSSIDPIDLQPFTVKLIKYGEKEFRQLIQRRPGAGHRGASGATADPGHDDEGIRRD
jgi:hypothetical protein